MKLSSHYLETRFIYFFFNNTFFLDLLDLKYNELHIGRSCLSVGTFYFSAFRPLRSPPRETWMKSRFMNKVKYTSCLSAIIFVLLLKLFKYFLYFNMRITVVCGGERKNVLLTNYFSLLGRGRAKLIHSWAGREWSKPQENRLSLRFCPNNVIFLRYWQQLCGGGRSEIILSENILFGFYKILSSFLSCQQAFLMSMIKWNKCPRNWK